MHEQRSIYAIYFYDAHLYFRLNYFIGGLQPRDFHVINVAIHALATGLFLHVCRQVALLDNGLEAVTAGIMFAVHPIHCEAVSQFISLSHCLWINFDIFKALHSIR
jgi:hypothetical protein